MWTIEERLNKLDFGDQNFFTRLKGNRIESNTLELKYLLTPRGTTCTIVPEVHNFPRRRAFVCLETNFPLFIGL